MAWTIHATPVHRITQQEGSITMSDNPTSITIFGRLSYPVFNYKEALANNQRGPNPNPDPLKVTPEFNLLLEQDQYEKIRDHLVNVFIPYCVEQSKAGEKKNALTPAEAKRILTIIENESWDDQPPYIPIKPVSVKTAELMPEAVVSFKVKGNRAVDIEERAVVRKEDQLLNQDPTVPFVQAVRPIRETVFSLYPGCWAGATLNLYSYLSGKVPGVSASAGVCVFKADADRFGGGAAVDEDAMFLE